MTIQLRTNVTGTQQALLKLQELFAKLQSPEAGLVKATNALANVWGQNYDSEGGMVGGWPALAARTVAERERQGYDGTSPILFRYGALRGVVIDTFKSATGPVSNTDQAPYSQHSVTADLAINGQVATLSAAGYPALNQLGYGSRSGTVPARPYWFVDSAAIAAARGGVVDWVVEVIDSLNGSA